MTALEHKHIEMLVFDAFVVGLTNTNITQLIVESLLSDLSYHSLTK